MLSRVNLRGWGGDGDICYGDGVGTGTVVMGTGWGWGQRLWGWVVFMGTGGGGVQFLSPCRPLVQMDRAYCRPPTIHMGHLKTNRISEKWSVNLAEGCAGSMQTV